MNNKSSKLNILHLCSWFPNRVSINDGNFVFKYIRTINNHTNSKVLTVYQDDNLKDKSSEIVHINDENIKGIIIYFRKYRFSFVKYILIFWYYYRGYKILKKEMGKIDLIHSHVFIYSSIIAWFISITEKIPYIVTEHSTIFFSRKILFPVKSLFNLVSRKSKFILPVSDGLKEKMELLGIKGNYIKVPNVIDTEIFCPIKKEKTDEIVRFLHISSFHENKNIPGILRTVKKLSQIRSDFVFTIAGDGNLNKVIELKDKYNIEDKYLKLHGKLEEHEVAEFIQANDVFVMFSNFETFSIVIAEALACGLPVITSDLPNVPEFEGSNGVYIVEPRDEQALLNAMIYMINNHSNYDKNKLHEFVVKNFSNEVVGEKLLKIYNSTVISTNKNN